VNGTGGGQGFTIRLLTENAPTSIRAVSALSDSVVWVCGSAGHVGRSTDGGKTWRWSVVPGGEKLDLRSMAAFDTGNAVVAVAGAPAFIFRTTDAGAHWEKVYTNRDTAVFLDGMTFRDKKHGIAYGDPIRGRFLILGTRDGGKHWKALPRKDRPLAEAGEASFAASNSAIASLGRRLWIGTGGSVARVLRSKNFGRRWKAVPTGMLQGKNSTGIFSVAFFDPDNGFCVGGDYAADSVRLANALITTDGGSHWKKPIIGPHGYRSSVTYHSRDTLFATGTSGTGVSTNGGHTWKQISRQGFNVVQRAREGSSVFLAGAKGRIARIGFSTRYAGELPNSLKAKE
jgi:photosystem II stability/assembly factor-like uncharacterized protein